MILLATSNTWYKPIVREAMGKIPSSPVSDLKITAAPGEVTLTLQTGQGRVTLHFDISALDDLTLRLARARQAAIIMKVTKPEVPLGSRNKS